MDEWQTEMQLKPMRVAIIGHSYTIPLHWSSPSSFTQFAITLMGQVNPKVEFHWWGIGGMSYTQARDLFLKPALEWKPDHVFMMGVVWNEKDAQAAADIARALQKAGVTCTVFPHVLTFPNGDKLREVAKTAPLMVAPIEGPLEEGPKDQYVSLDGIHMREPFHRVMAKVFLKLLIERGE